VDFQLRLRHVAMLGGGVEGFAAKPGPMGDGARRDQGSATTPPASSARETSHFFLINRVTRHLHGFSHKC